MSRPPVTQLPVHDAVTAAAWRFTEAGWRALTDAQRADRRRDITHAPNFQNGTP